MKQKLIKNKLNKQADNSKAMLRNLDRTKIVKKMIGTTQLKTIV